MDSNYFFEHERSKWDKKAGVYCIEQPALSKFYGKRIFKVGYAQNSIVTRLSNYRTAYSIIPFKIYCLIQIPAGVLGKRPGYTLLSEQRLHKQLKEDGRGAGANEWYFDLDHIMNVMYSLYLEVVGTTKHGKDWEVFFYDAKRQFNIVSVVDEKQIKSKTYDENSVYGERLKTLRSRRTTTR